MDSPIEYRFYEALRFEVLSLGWAVLDGSSPTRMKAKLIDAQPRANLGDGIVWLDGSGTEFHGGDADYDVGMCECDGDEEDHKDCAVSSESRPAGGPRSFYAEVLVIPQVSVGRYRADFIVDMCAIECARVVVECDGHDFHERTKEQATRDRRRDREMLAMGLPVLRFTGQELHAGPKNAAREVLRFLEARCDERFARVGG